MTWLTLQRRGDRGSLPMALMVITVGLLLSAAITPVVVRQITSTRTLASHDVALNAAQAGIDVMLARVRAASDLGSGLPELLPPCTLSGDAGVSDAGESLPYYVSIQYRDQDGVPVTCPVTDVPTTAFVQSIGYGTTVPSPGGGTSSCPTRPASPDVLPCRILTATYVFSTSNTNIPGGSIEIRSSILGHQCIDAGTAAKSPSKNTLVVMKPCNGSSAQQFGYTSDLYLKLIHSETTSAPYGMCLETLPTHQHGNGNYARWDVCPSDRTPRFQWSLDGNGRFGSTACCDSKGKGITENGCLSLQNPNGADSLLVLGDCDQDQYYNDTNEWISSTGVGAGSAGSQTDQLVNYEQFSRCLDVTDANPAQTYMIVWFCKQSPAGKSGVWWNQKWVSPASAPGATSVTGPIVVTDAEHSNTPYCLSSPLNLAAKPYVTVVNCSNPAARAAPAVTWTFYFDTGTYATSYRIMDSAGHCLTPTSQTAIPKDAYEDGTSKAQVAICDSSELQKWNAPPNIKKPTSFTYLTEK